MNLKRFAALAVALMMALSVFTACGKENIEPSPDGSMPTIDPSISVGDVTTASPDTLSTETATEPVTTSAPVTADEPTTTPEPVTTPTPTTTKQDPNGFTVESMSATMYATMSLNVRSGPSTDYDRIGTLNEGEAVTVTGRASTGWYQINYKGSTGYVSNIYMSSTAPSATTQATGGNTNPSSSGQEIVDDEPNNNPQPGGATATGGNWVDVNGANYMYGLFTDSKYQMALNKIAMAIEAMAPSVSLAEYLTHEETLDIASNIIQLVGTGYCYFEKVTTVSGTTMNLQYFVDTYEEAQKMVSDLESAANKVVNSISGYSDYNKIKYIFEWLCTNDTYGGTYQSSTYGAVVTHGANCLGYAKGTFYLLSKAGFDVVYATGWGDQASHAWVKVKLNGKWYNIDTTWGDPQQSFDSNYLVYDFLLVNDDYMANTRTSVYDLSKYYTMPAATSDDYNWYKLNGYYASNMSEVNSILKKATQDAVQKGGEYAYARIMLSSVDLFNQVLDTYSQSYYTENVLSGITSNYKIVDRLRDNHSGVKKTRTIVFKLQKK